MRIGLVSAEYPPAVGGVGDHTARLAQELARLGHSVEVVTSACHATPAGMADGPSDGTQDRVSTWYGVDCWDWRILRRLPAMARTRQWDVLHVQYQPAAYGLRGAITLLPAAMRLARVRCATVTTFHDLRVPYLFPKAGPLRRLSVRALAAGSDGAIAVAEEDAGTLASWRRGAPATTAHIPLGNQLDAPPPAGYDPERWRGTLGLPASSVLAGYLGFVNRSKGVDDLVRAINILVRDGSDVHLLMIGEELGSSDITNRAYAAEVRTLIERSGLSQRVHWTGYLPPAKISAWLRCVDVAALPFAGGASLRRTSLIASWAHGVPVVTTTPAHPATWVQLEDGRATARLVPPGDADALAEALAALAADEAARRRLAGAGQVVARRFDWPSVARRTGALYALAIERRASRPAND